MTSDEAIALEGVVVVLSAHLDDGVFSLGAAMSRAVRAGSVVTVLTVLAGDPRSTAGPSTWDAACGYASAAAAASGRRLEDDEACRHLGVDPVWLPFDDASYGRPRSDDEIWDAIESRLGNADIVMAPGFPLSHPDHAWLAGLVLARSTRSRLGLYLEQPYAYHYDGPISTRVPAPIDGSIEPLRWRSIRVARRDRRAKRRAVGAYRSQLPSLSDDRFLVARLARYERSRGGETIAWIERRAV